MVRRNEWQGDSIIKLFEDTAKRTWCNAIGEREVLRRGVLAKIAKDEKIERTNSSQSGPKQRQYGRCGRLLSEWPDTIR